ncbi:hypothetical protein AC1031_020105 [Aphanomyces cochlioides]|nr:hypothetical protein AC1031_020105 [Aphanomyces cochlioides]
MKWLGLALLFGLTCTQQFMIDFDSSDVVHCNKTQYDEVKVAVSTSANLALCAEAIGVTPDVLLNGKIENEALGKVKGSDACEHLYVDIQVASAGKDCIELDAFQNITWTMATALVDMGALPKASTPCDKKKILQLFMLLPEPAFLVLVPPFRGLSDLPSVEQLEVVRSSNECRAIANELDSSIAAFPHCSIDSNGTDIHVFEVITFDVLVDWMEFSVNLQTHARGVGPSMLSSMTSQLSNATHAGEFLSMAAAIGCMVVGALVAVMRKWRSSSAGYVPIGSTSA